MLTFCLLSRINTRVFLFPLALMLTSIVGKESEEPASVKVTDDVVGTLQHSNLMLFVLSLVRIQIDCSCYQTNLFRLNKHLIRLSIGTFVHTTHYLVILDNVLNNQMAGREHH